MKSFPPVYLLIGDAFRSEEKYKSIAESLRRSFAGEVLVSTLRLSEAPLDSVLTQARSLPFLAGAQIFRIREAEEIGEDRKSVV